MNTWCTRLSRQMFAGALGALLPAAGWAQATAPVLYRIDPAGNYTEGCYPPCACPIFYTEDLLGTFTLAFTFSDPAYFDHYRFDAVNWVVSFGAIDKRVTGSGEYILGGQVAILQRLQLDLSVDGAAPEHFDSGLQQGGGSFPRVAIDVSLNGMFCYDKVYSIQATPVPASQVVPYVMRRSAYEEGCFAPCTCPLVLWRAVGTLGLVDLGPASDPARQYFALVDIAWHTVSASNPPDRSFMGQGIYGRHLDTVRHRLECDLTDQNGVTQLFDSRLISGGALFPPRISLPISVNDFVCFDQVFLVNARPQ